MAAVNSVVVTLGIGRWRTGVKECGAWQCGTVGRRWTTLSPRAAPRGRPFVGSRAEPAARRRAGRGMRQDIGRRYPAPPGFVDGARRGQEGLVRGRRGWTRGG